MNAPTPLSDLMRAAQAADQQVTALAEIHLALSKLRSKTAFIDVLLGLSEHAEFLSGERDDTMNIIALSIDSCVELIEDQTDGDPSDAAEVIRLDNKERAADMAGAK